MAQGGLGQIARRLSLYYAAGFLVVGIKSPFWPVWLAGRGLDAREIAAVFAAAIWIGVALSPAAGALADRLGRRRALMIALAGGALVLYAGLWRASGFWTVLGLTAAAAGAQSALMPLGDSLTLSAVRERGVDYGRVRVWGSVSFIGAAIASGLLLSGTALGAPGGNTVLVLVIGASALLFAACLALPAGPGDGAGPARRPALAALARNGRFWRFVATAAALQASHQLYYGFGTLYWRSLGFSDATIGVLWAEGVVAEIVLFWQGGRLLARLGPLGLMAAGGVAGVVRWSLMALAPGLLPSLALQTLHALTFGATHLGVMNFLSRSVPPGASASAQALYAGASSGIGSGLVMVAAGALYADYGGRAYLFMAALSALGLASTALFARSAGQRPHFG
ncbi:MAG TPA: MFS transporter [Stellaceae bacterium]|nr:MFS transporter [Stellaceae bacterium]